MPSRFPLSDLAERADRGELHIAYDHATAVGAFAVDYHADPEFWHDDPNGALAGYLDRLAVARTHAGRGIDAQLVDQAAYYRQLGFTHADTVDLPHRKSGALFEREIIVDHRGAA